MEHGTTAERATGSPRSGSSYVPYVNTEQGRRWVDEIGRCSRIDRGDQSRVIVMTVQIALGDDDDRQHSVRSAKLTQRVHSIIAGDPHSGVAEHRVAGDDLVAISGTQVRREGLERSVERDEVGRRWPQAGRSSTPGVVGHWLSGRRSVL